MSQGIVLLLIIAVIVAYVITRTRRRLGLAVTGKTWATIVATWPAPMKWFTCKSEIWTMRRPSRSGCRPGEGRRMLRTVAPPIASCMPQRHNTMATARTIQGAQEGQYQPAKPMSNPATRRTKSRIRKVEPRPIKKNASPCRRPAALLKKIMRVRGKSQRAAAQIQAPQTPAPPKGKARASWLPQNQNADPAMRTTMDKKTSMERFRRISQLYAAEASFVLIF